MTTVHRRLRTAGAAARAVAEKQPPRARPQEIHEERAHGSISTSMSRKKQIIDETDRQLDAGVVRFAEDQKPAYVRVGAGLTLNLGDFQSLRIDCSITLPCLPEDVETAYETASQFVADKIGEEQNRWLPPVAPATTNRRGH